MEQNVNHILENEDLKWVFMSGTARSGRTTVSCCLASLLSKVRKNVLLVSADPSHSISNVFSQNFSRHPMKVSGYDNLFAVEIKVYSNLTFSETLFRNQNGNNLDVNIDDMMEVAKSFPGLDEFCAYWDIFKMMLQNRYSVIVFDTPASLETCRLLFLLFNTNKFLDGFDAYSEDINQYVSMFENFGIPMFNGFEKAYNKILELVPFVREITDLIRNPTNTIFNCVAEADFVSHFETDDFVVKLLKFGINVDTIFINRMLSASTCEFCIDKRNTQLEFLEHMSETFRAFNIVQLPVLASNKSSRDWINDFSKHMI